MISKLSNLNSNLALTLGYLNLSRALLHLFKYILSSAIKFVSV